MTKNCMFCFIDILFVILLMSVTVFWDYNCRFAISLIICMTNSTSNGILLPNKDLRKCECMMLMMMMMMLYSFPNLGTRWAWVINATLRPLYPREWPGTHCAGVWVGPRTGLDGCKNLAPTGIFLFSVLPLYYFYVLIVLAVPFCPYRTTHTTQTSDSNPQSQQAISRRHAPWTARPLGPGFDPQTVQPVAGCYTYYTIPAHLKLCAHAEARHDFFISFQCN
jgi:hypothetical protein